MLTETSIALERARSDDECTYAFYSQEYAEAVFHRQQIVQDLKYAIERKQLFVLMQPQVRLLSQCERTLTGAEVLLRWHHPEHGTISPDIFIPIAESTGLVRDLGTWTLNRACEYIKHWHKVYGWSPRLAVNFSAREFADEGFAQHVRSILLNHGVASEFIEVEITESTAMQHTDSTLQNLEALHKFGIRIAIDDFGTGYSSLGELRRLPIDVIKIDKSLVRDIGQDGDAEAICKIILSLGQTLGLTIIAEGVENQQQLDYLCQHHCDQAQGFLLDKPLGAVDFANRWLQP